MNTTTHIRRILVAVKDCNGRMTPALIKAGQLARALGAHLEIFHAITTPLYVDGYITYGLELPHIERTTHAQVLKKLEIAARRLRREGVEVSTAAEWDFPVYEAIVRRAKQIKADLVVADQHAGPHRLPALLRLTDWELLRLSPVPVLLVKTGGRYRKPAILAAIDPQHTFSKPAKLDRGILDVTSTVAHALQGTQHVLHAYAPFPINAKPETLTSQEVVEELQAEAAAVAQKTFDTALRSRRIPKARRHLVGRHPPDAIAQTARQVRSAIVVMGAISRSGIRRLLIGNTAERVLDQLTCDILVVKPEQFASRVPRARRGARVVAIAGNMVPL